MFQEKTSSYARWNVIVAFDSNGGSNVSSQTIDYNSKATRPNSPTRDNYSFAGWYSDAQLTNVFDFNTNITTYTKLFAKWVETGRLDTSINAEKYGYRVKGYKSANYSGYWRLFYQDENCTYIIADPTSSTYKLSDYYTSYNSGANVSIQGRNLNNQLNSNGKFFADTNTNNNIKATAWLTDTSSNSICSTTYKDSEGVAQYAIGAPTLELFAESYKATHPQASVSLSITNSSNIYGYSVSGLSGNSSDNYGIYGPINISWFSSPYPGNNLLFMNAYGSIFGSTSYSDVTQHSNTIRPIVCIPTYKFNESCTLTNDT